MWGSIFQFLSTSLLPILRNQPKNVNEFQIKYQYLVRFGSGKHRLSPPLAKAGSQSEKEGLTVRHPSGTAIAGYLFRQVKGIPVTALGIS